MSEATEVGSIIGYLSLNRDQWNRDIRATEDDVRKLGSLSPTIKVETNAESILAQLAAIRAAAGDVGRQSPSVHVSSNASEQTAQMHLLLDSILLLSAAAIPIAGVLGGVALGAVPVLASVALGIKGIENAQKSGLLQNSQYGKDFATLHNILGNLQTMAARGLLPGIDKGLANSRGLVHQLDIEVGTTSAQMGAIAEHVGPAFLGIFTQLNPLFVTFGNLVAHGAVELEHWTQSGKGMTGFVSYVQANLPSVMNFLGNLITLISHVAQAGAGFGGGMLTGLNLLVHAIDSLPIGVLQVLIQLIVAARTAMLANAAVVAVSDRISAALARQAAANALAAKSAELSSLQVQLAAADEEVTVTAAKAAEARAAADTAVEVAAAAARVDIALGLTAGAAARAALEFAAAMERESDAAIAAAAKIALAAQVVTAEIETTAVVTASALGPIVALAAGVAILSTAFFGNHDAAKDAAAAQDSYSQSVQTSTDAMNAANIAQTNKNLSDKGALTNLAKLTAANKDLTVSNVDLSVAVNGTAEQYNGVVGKLKAVEDQNKSLYQSGAGSEDDHFGYLHQWGAADKLLKTLGTLRSGLQDQILTQTQLNEVNTKSVGITDSQAVAGAQLFGLVGTNGVASYLAAQQAAKKNTDQTTAQTLAWQLANDAASLLQQELDKLSGKTISYAQANNSFEQQLISLQTSTAGLTGASSKHALAVEAEAVAQQKYDAALANPKTSATSLASALLALHRAQASVVSSGTGLTAAEKKAATTLTGMSAAAVQNRGNLISLIQSAETTADAYGKMNGSTEAGRLRLIQLRQAIIDNAVAHGEDRKSVTAYIDSLLKIPPATTAANKTQYEANTDAAKAKVVALQKQINDIKQGKVPGVAVYSADAKRMIGDLQDQINALTGKTITISVDVALAQAQDAAKNAALQYIRGDLGTGKPAAPSKTKAPHKAAGGRIVGPGGPVSDSILMYASSNEEMMNAAAVSKFGPILDAMNAGKPTAFDAPSARPVLQQPASVSRSSSVSTSNSHVEKHQPVNITVNYPKPKTWSESVSDAMEAATNAIGAW